MPLPSLLPLTGGFVLIVAGSALFTRSIEKTAVRFFDNKNRGLRILGNLSLSLPELLIPLIAFLSPGKDPDTVLAGTGAIFGSPLFLLFFLLPLGLFLTLPELRTLRKEIPLLLTGVAGALLLFGHTILLRSLLALLLGGLYLYGVFSIPETQETPSKMEEAEAPWRTRDGLMVIVGALLMGVGSRVFLSGINLVKTSLGLSPFWTALVLAPLATEAPELFTLLHFLRRKHIPASFSILWGSIHLQITLSLALGLVVSPWTGSLGAITAGEVLLGVLGILFVFAWLRRGGHRGLLRP